jgi:hypothetical protein
MILFPNKDILTQEIQSWQGFAETLRSEDRKLFSQMLNDCYQLNDAINTKGEYFSTESLLMGLVFVQHKIINWLINNNSKDIQQ